MSLEKMEIFRQLHKSCIGGLVALISIFALLLGCAFYVGLSGRVAPFLTSTVFALVLSGLFVLVFLSVKIRLAFKQFVDFANLVSQRNMSGMVIGNNLQRSVRSVFMTFKTQSAGVLNVLTTVEEIGAVLSEVAKSTEITLQQSIAMQNGASEGLLSVQRLQSAMSEIESANTQIEGMHKVIRLIGEKTSIINDIVFRTQLLSFNAAIEAARAGKHGLGFSVVATEIGKLSQIVGEAAEDISKLLEQSQLQAKEAAQSIRQRISGGKSASDECSAAFTKINSNINEIAPMIEMIKATAEMQERSLLSTMREFQDIRAFHENVESMQESSETGLAQLADHNQRSAEAIDQLKAIRDDNAIGSNYNYKETA